MAGIIKKSLGVLWLSFLMVPVKAQYDSSFSQFWNRDPNFDLTSTTSNQKQIITKNQIEYSGYTVLSDVLQLIDGWTISTWNGDRWNLQNNGGTYQEQNWTLMLNGQRIEIMKLDAQNLNALGISITDIERIEIVNVVGNYLGEFNDKGIIHIITKTTPAGLTYRAFIGNGNEIGDPHLNVLNTPGLNVHEYGTVFTNHLGFTKNKWSIQVGQFFNYYFYRETTEQIFYTVQAFNPSAKQYNQTLGGNIQLSYTTPKVYHQLSGFVSSVDDVVLPAGILAPFTAKHNLISGGYLMTTTLSHGILKYRAGVQYRNVTGIDRSTYSHSQTYQNHNINYTKRKTTSKGAMISQLGLGIDQFTTIMNDTNQRNKNSFLIRPFYSITYPISKKSTVFTDISATTDFRFWTPKLSFGYYKQPSILSNWSIVGSFSQRNQTENNSFFTMLTLIDTSFNFWANSTASSATLDYYYNINIAKYFKVSFNTGIKHTDNAPYIEPIATPVAFDPLLRKTTLSTVRQTNWINRVNIHYDILKNTRFDLNYHNTNLVGNKPEFSNIPKHRFSFVIYHTLPARFIIWSRYYYQSQTQWLNPKLIRSTIPLDNNNAYVPQAALHAVDIGVTKRVLKEYLVLNLTTRNVLNGTEQYQANGAFFQFRLFLSIRLNIAAFNSAQ